MRRVVRKGLSEMGTFGWRQERASRGNVGKSVPGRGPAGAKPRGAEVQTCSGNSLEVMTLE